MWDILYKKNISNFSKYALKTCFITLMILMRYYTNSLEKYFDKLSLNTASCQTADSTDSVRISKGTELKDLKTTWLSSSTKNVLVLHNIRKCAKNIK